MAEKFNYYREEMTRILPVDKYGISIQIKTSTGHTKWMSLNQESYQSIQEVFELPTKDPGPNKISVLLDDRDTES